MRDIIVFIVYACIHLPAGHRKNTEDERREGECDDDGNICGSRRRDVRDSIGIDSTGSKEMSTSFLEGAQCTMHYASTCTYFQILIHWIRHDEWIERMERGGGA